MRNAQKKRLEIEFLIVFYIYTFTKQRINSIPDFDALPMPGSPAFRSTE